MSPRWTEGVPLSLPPCTPQEKTHKQWSRGGRKTKRSNFITSFNFHFYPVYFLVIIHVLLCFVFYGEGVGGGGGRRTRSGRQQRNRSYNPRLLIGTWLFFFISFFVIFSFYFIFRSQSSAFQGGKENWRRRPCGRTDGRTEVCSLRTSGSVCSIVFNQWTQKYQRFFFLSLFFLNSFFYIWSTVTTAPVVSGIRDPFFPFKALVFTLPPTPFFI